MGVAPAGGAVVTESLGYMVCFLIAAAGYFTVRGIIATWTHSIGFLLTGLAGVLVFSVPVPFHKVNIDLGGPLRDLDRLVLTALQNWAAGLEAEMSYFLHGNAVLWEWFASELHSMADATAQWGEWVVGHEIPKWAKWAGGAALGALPFGKIAQLVYALVKPYIAKLVHEAEHIVPTIVTKVIHYGGAIAPPNPWAFPRFHRWWHDLTKWREVTQRRLARLEKLLGVAGMAAVMANVLGLPNWRCLTRGNIGKVSRALCGLGTVALEDILGLLVDALILEDICSILSLLTKGFSLIEGPLTAFVTAAETWACYGVKEKPRKLDIPELHLPAVTGIVLYLP